MNITIFTGPNPSENITELFKRTPLRRGPVCAIVPDSRSITAMQKRLAGLSDQAFVGHKVFTMERLSLAILSQSGQPPFIIKDHIKRTLITEIIKSRIVGKSSFSSISDIPHYPSQI